MKRLLFSIFLLGGLSFALAAVPVYAQKPNEIVINKKPLRDFALTVKTKRVDWTKPFLVEVEGVLTKDGKLTQAEIVKTDGDKELTEIAQQGVLAVGDSGWLGYLRMHGVDKIKFVIAQTAENFSFTFVSELPTPERAKVVASGMANIIAMALIADKNGIKKLGDDERILLNNTKVTAGEKTANITFVMPASEFREMIRRRLNESKTETNG